MTNEGLAQMDPKPELQGADRNLGPRLDSKLLAQDHTRLANCRVGDPELSGYFSIPIATHNPLQHGKLQIG
jgi:hypothetical protein